MKPGTNAAIMFHSVGTPSPDWSWSFLTVPWQMFEGLLIRLRRMRYRTVLLDEYRDIFLAGKLDKERVVALTFDDGYLDNWTYVAPLLEQYGACGTVFVTGDFIDPGEAPRPRWNGNENDLPPSDGFLNKAELRILDSSGVLDVQSHGMTHTWYPCGPEIIDFRHPDDTYHWMDWNDAPDAKWRQIQPISRQETWGEPVYEHHKALNGPRYFPDPKLAEELRLHVAREGESFFHRQDWKSRLMVLARERRQDMPEGHWEDEDDFNRRVQAELGGSAKALSALLGKRINWLCWPGGGYGRDVFTTAARYYAGTTISSSSEGNRAQGLDELGCFRFKRFGPLHTGTGVSFRYLGPLTNSLYIEERRSGSQLCRLVRGGLTRLGRLGLV